MTVTSADVQYEPALKERLEPPAETRPSFTHTLCNRVDPSMLGRVEMQNIVCLSVPNSPQDDGFCFKGFRHVEGMIFDQAESGTVQNDETYQRSRPNL